MNSIAALPPLPSVLLLRAPGTGCELVLPAPCSPAGNYTEYVKQKEVATAQQWVAWEKQQKEISRQVR